MIETVVRNYLKEKLDVPVYLVAPSETPKKYVTLERTGGSRKNFINSATFAIQSCSAQSLTEAAKLNEQVKEVMDGITLTTGIYGAHLNSDYNFTDTTTKVYRYQAVYNITY